MTLRPISATAVLVLALCGCGGGGGSSGGGAEVPPPASATRVLVKATSEQGLQDLCDAKGATLVGEIPGTDYAVVEVPAGTSTDDFLKDLENEAEVEAADHDEGVSFPEGGGSTIPAFGDDPFEAVGTQAAMTVIGAPDAHARGFLGAGVVVAVIDTGIVASHPLVAGHVAPDGYDFVDEDADPTDVGNGIDDDGDGLIDEGVGHGTFVASLILAVAPEATILPLRALDSDAVGTASGVARAIAYAVAHGAAVINLSAGLVTDLEVIQEAVQSAKAAGVPVVAAAGNRGAPQPDFPAALSEVEAVTAVDEFGLKPPFASFGSAVDLCAPGVDLVGAHPLSPSGTARWSGTSFSTALVTGSFAVLRGRDPAASSDALLQALENVAMPVDAANPAFSGRMGRGRVDVGAAAQ